MKQLFPVIKGNFRILVVGSVTSFLLFASVVPDSAR